MEISAEIFGDFPVQKLPLFLASLGPYNPLQETAMRVVYMGTPAFAIPPLEELLARGHEVVGVYTQPDRPSGRGRSVEAPPVKAFALERGLDVFQPTSLRNAEAHSRLAALAPDVIAIAAYGRILPEEVVNMAPGGCVNVHPSLLPRHRGPSPVAFTILEGDETAGVSIMLLDEGMDSGPVIAQVEEIIHPDDTTESLTDRLFRKGAKLLADSLSPFLQGDIAPRPQDDARATYARRLTKEDGEIRWELPAETPVATGPGVPPVAGLLHPVERQAAEGAGNCASCPGWRGSSGQRCRFGEGRPRAGWRGHRRWSPGPQAGAA